MKTLIEWFQQAVRHFKRRRAAEAARSEELWLRSVRVWLRDGSSHNLDDLQRMKDRLALLEDQLRLRDTELAESRGRVVQLEVELRDSPFKALVREIVRDGFQRAVQEELDKGGYQEGRT